MSCDVGEGGEVVMWQSTVGAGSGECCWEDMTGWRAEWLIKSVEEEVLHLPTSGHPSAGGCSPCS